MKISVKVKPNAKEYRVEKLDESNFVVWVKEKPQEGRANKAVVELLADYFGAPKSSVVLIVGKTSKNKIFEIKF